MCSQVLLFGQHTWCGRRCGGDSKSQSAWAKFKELSPILTAQGASYHIKGKIYKACFQSVWTYGTETSAMKKSNLHVLERTEQIW